MISDYEEKSVGFLVAEQPLRAAIFERFGIDYCCGGKEKLETACLRAAVPPESVMALLREMDRRAQANAPSKATAEHGNCLSMSLTELSRHIEDTHHHYLKRELPRLEKLAARVAHVHGQKDARLLRLSSVFSALRQELDQHTLKEERVLFPHIRQLEQVSRFTRAPFGTVANPLRCMEMEHESAGRALQELRLLTDGYAIPEQACESWRALLLGLAELERDLKTHIHKENSILFPGALLAEEQLERS